MDRLCLACKPCLVLATSAALLLAGGGLADTVRDCDAAASITLSGPPASCSLPENASELAAKTVTYAATTSASTGLILEDDDSAPAGFSGANHESRFVALAEASIAVSESGSLTLVALGFLLLGVAGFARQAQRTKGRALKKAE